MIFTPDQPLPRDAKFTAQVAAGAEAKAGAAGTTEDYVWNFTTVKEPGRGAHRAVRTGARASHPTAACTSPLPARWSATAFSIT